MFAFPFPWEQSEIHVAVVVMMEKYYFEDLLKEMCSQLLSQTWQFQNFVGGSVTFIEVSKKKNGGVSETLPFNDFRQLKSDRYCYECFSENACALEFFLTWSKILCSQMFQLFISIFNKHTILVKFQETWNASLLQTYLWNELVTHCTAKVSDFVPCLNIRWLVNMDNR